MKKNNIISDWLKKYNDPKIEEQVKLEVKRKLLDSIMEENAYLNEIISKNSRILDKINKDDMCNCAKEYIGTWFQIEDDYFKIIKCDNGIVYLFYSRTEYNGFPLFDYESMNLFEWSNAKPLKEIPETLQKRIDEYRKNLS